MKPGTPPLTLQRVHESHQGSTLIEGFVFHATEFNNGYQHLTMEEQQSTDLRTSMEEQLTSTEWISTIAVRRPTKGMLEDLPSLRSINTSQTFNVKLFRYFPALQREVVRDTRRER